MNICHSVSVFISLPPPPSLILLIFPFSLPLFLPPSLSPPSLSPPSLPPSLFRELEGLCRQAYLYLQQVAKDRDGLFDVSFVRCHGNLLTRLL